VNQIKRCGDAARERPTFRRWLRDKLWTVGVAAFLTGAGVAVDRFSDEINAWVRAVFIGGIGGTYTLQTFTYPEGSTTIAPEVSTVELKDGGGTVFGRVEAQVSGYRYKFFGYHRVKFLMLSYGGEGPLGSGTVALQANIATGSSPVFWGRRTSVECIGTDSFLVECPALMLLKGTQVPKDYEHFLQVDRCFKVTSDRPPEMCADLKKLK
jgi:hypothetical protein